MFEFIIVFLGIFTGLCCIAYCALFLYWRLECSSLSLEFRVLVRRYILYPCSKRKSNVTPVYQSMSRETFTVTLPD